MQAKYIIIIGIILSLLIFITTRFFGFYKEKPTNSQLFIKPYNDSSVNFMYNLLFCDNLNLLQQNTKGPYIYPYNILFAAKSSITDLQKIIDDTNSESRIRLFAFNKQFSMIHKSPQKELLGVVIEVGLGEGLDVLAAYKDGRARYINYTGKILVWEKTNDAKVNEISQQLFEQCNAILPKIDVWKKPRKPNPTSGNVRITFLVSDGIYIKEGPIDVIFTEPTTNPVLTSATELMQYLMSLSLEQNN